MDEDHKAHHLNTKIMTDKHLAELKDLHDNAPRRMEDILLDRVQEEAKHRETANTYWTEARHQRIAPAFEMAAKRIRETGWQCSPDLKEPYGGSLAGTLTLTHQQNGKTVEIKFLGNAKNGEPDSYQLHFGAEGGYYSHVSNLPGSMSTEEIAGKLIEMATFAAKLPARR